MYSNLKNKVSITKLRLLLFLISLYLAFIYATNLSISPWQLYFYLNLQFYIFSLQNSFNRL